MPTKSLVIILLLFCYNSYFFKKILISIFSRKISGFIYAHDRFSARIFVKITTRENFYEKGYNLDVNVNTQVKPQSMERQYQNYNTQRKCIAKISILHIKSKLEHVRHISTKSSILLDHDICLYMWEDYKNYQSLQYEITAEWG